MSGVHPRTAENRSAPPTARVHRMRTARGACWVIVAGTLGALGLVSLDAVAPLPGWVRGLGLATWLTGVGVLAWRLVVQPWREARSPGAPVPAPRDELPGNLRAVTAAALSLAACLLAATLVPGAADHLRRVAFPWQRGAVAQYRVVVTSGDAVVRRGGAVTLSAYAEKLDPAAPAAAKATFAIRPRSPAREEPVVAPADASGAFHITRSAGDTGFEYRVEVEGAVSEWYTVTAIDPVALAEGSTTALAPPPYASRAGTEQRAMPGFAALDGLPHATAEYQFRFTRPAAAASLEFVAPGASLELTPVALSDGGLSGSAAFRLKQDGILRLVLVAEEKGKKLRTDISATVRVKPDRVPEFTMVRGVSPRPATVRPGTIVAVEVAAADDVAVGAAVLEYVLDSFDSRSVTVPVPLSGTGRPEARGRLEFPLPKPVRQGETVRFRLRVADTRRLDDPELKPQEAVYPATGWATVQIDPSAPPLEEQEIAGRRDAVRDSLNAALKEAKESLENAETVLAEDRGQPTLATEHTVRLNTVREAAGRAAGILRDAAGEADLNPELRPLAAAARATAERLARDADEILKRVSGLSTERATDLATAVRSLADITERIDALVARNDRLARDRLDARALAALAAELAALAEKAPPPADALKAQHDLLARFEKLLADSDALRTALDGARQQEFQRLAALAADLASAVHDLNAAARTLHADARANLLGWVAAEQKALAARAVALLARIDTAARLANVTLPKPEAFDRIADLLGRGKTVEALVEMAGVAQSLAPVAATFEKWAADRADAKVAVRHLALWQDDLRARFRAATGGAGASFDGLAAGMKTRFRAEQAALVAAAGALTLPPGGNAKSARDSAVGQVREAARRLEGNGADADHAMAIAATELKRFADALPTIPERLTRTRAEFDKLWGAQAALQNAVEYAVRNTPDAAALAKKFTPLAGQQKTQHEKFAALDLPGMDARRVRVAAALTAAAGDLADTSPSDALASQAWVRRELEWVRTTLFDNAPPLDDRADEIARRLANAAKSVETLGLAMTDNQRAVHAATLQEVLRQINQFPACPEASVLLNDARDAIQTADAGFRNESAVGELTRRLRAAAAAARRLSDRLGGAESDLDRLRRLADYRRAGAAAAVKVASPGLAADVARQLGREIDELAHTRVGAAGQLHKKYVLNSYVKLKDHATPERVGGLHAGLAIELEELAALTADVAELTASFDRNTPSLAPSAADAFLPSKLLADELRDLARRYRDARAGVADLPGELARRMRPTDAKPLLALEKRQRELAADVAAFAAKVSVPPAELPVDLQQAAEQATRVADRLRDGSVPVAKQAARQTAVSLHTLGAHAGAKGAAPLAARQEAILKELSELPDTPGAAVARQHLRAGELARELTTLVQTLEAAARDAGPDEATAKVLAEAAATAKVAGKFLAEAAQAAGASKPDEAATLRTETAAHLRAAAGLVAGAGPVATTLPNLDGDAAAVGEGLRRADVALREAVRFLDGKPDQGGAAKALRTAAEALDRAAKVTAERLAAGR